MTYLFDMYMAYTQKNRRPHYVLRQSCHKKGQLTCEDIFSIGPDPSVYIKYVGCNAFYFDEEMEDQISSIARNYDPDELEDIFWPWVRPDVRRAVDTFRNRSAPASRKFTRQQKIEISNQIHGFDKRRAHFLKFGNMDQGPVNQMPAVLFLNLHEKSRDEIEQGFMRQESALKQRELKSYVYTIFDLQRFFKSFLARRMPHALDQDKVDTFFIEELCKLNDAFFDAAPTLNDYMIRYAIMFFDHQYADTTLLNDFAHAFMNRHRAPRQPAARKTVSDAQAYKIFNVSQVQLKTMTRQTLTRRYRKLARQHHPDAGGSHDKFVALTGAYQTLLEKINSKKTS